MRYLLLACPALLLLTVAGLDIHTSRADGDSRPATRSGPLTPREEQATFRVPAGLRVELVACEPNVVDPVAIAFDEEGRLFVAEMAGYPNAGVARGKITSGKIKMLEDRDGDGYYETCSLFAGGLRFPTSIQPWQGGLLVSMAPDIVYFEPAASDGKAGRQRTLYTGFGVDNIQGLVNGLQWGLDNWVHGGGGTGASAVRSSEKPDQPALALRGRGVRFHPELPGSLEPTSGGGQFGLAPDAWEHWFTATNSQHLRQIILPDHYLRRNPGLAVGAVTHDIPDHGAACQVFRISPFEDWRVERTQRRKGGPDAQRFPPTELFPGGFITSACSPVVYTATLLPAPYRGNSFVCEPANNLIHRDVLVPHGPAFVAERGDKDHEFLAATDVWFRPVNLTIGPDGALYVVDFYREVIETPLSLPEDIKKKLNLASRGRGRIWRIRPDGEYTSRKPSLRKAASGELVRLLADDNSWWRLTAQRLLVERQDKSVVPALAALARASASPYGKVHALWTLHGLHALDDASIDRALNDAHPGVREQALRLAEGRLASSAALRATVLKMTDDSSPQVRFQLAFTIGDLAAPEASAVLARLLRRDGDDPWVQTAALSSAARLAPGLLEALAGDPDFVRALTPGRTRLLTRLAALVGVGADDATLGAVLKLLEARPANDTVWRLALLEGLGEGMQNSRRTLSGVWERPPAGLKDALARTLPFFRRAAAAAADEARPLTERIPATRLLGYGPFAVGSPTLSSLLAARQPPEIQLAAVHALSLQDDTQVAAILLASWAGHSPAVRREAIEALFSRTDRLRQLLTAIEKKQVLAAQLEPARVERLLRHPDAKLRARAAALLASRTSDRQKVVDAYRPVLDLAGDAGRGKAVFKKVCATCHRLENEGTHVGPDLLSALKTKTRPGLLVDILDPSREVDPRYINYVVTTKAGRDFTGMIAAESASSITLRRAERAEDTILRSQVEEIRATAKSLMPDELEKLMSKQDLADVIEYLQAVAGPTGKR